MHLLCQDRELGARPEGVTVHIPDIGRVLPVYVADTYEGFDAKPYPELTDEELDHYIAANVEAVRAAPPPDVALANHLVMGPVILAARRRGALRGEDPRQRARVHGAPAPGALPALRARGDPAARGRAGGLATTPANSLFEVLSDEPVAAGAHPARAARRGRPRVPPAASPTWSGWRLAAGRRRGAASRAPPEVLRELDLSSGPDRELRGQADRLEGRGPAAGGLAARGRAACPDARLVVVGFGTYRDALVRFVEALRGARPRGAQGHRRARPRARGRPAGRAAAT